MYQDHCFYVMEFVEGETVEAHVSRRGPLPEAEALGLALQVARALAALKDAVGRVQEAPHRRLREVYGLETAQEGSVLVEEHAWGPSLLEVLRYRGAFSAPEVVRLVNRLAPLVDHARAHRLERVELTLPGIHLIDPASSGSGTQSARLPQPLTAWPGLELKVNAIDFSFSCAPAGDGAAAATQAGNGTARTPRGSYLRLLGLPAYETLGGPRARVEATDRYVPVAASGEEGNAVLRRALVDAWPSGEELAQQLAASVGDAGPAAPVPDGAGRETPPKVAPADALKKRRFRGNRTRRWPLVLGLVVLVGLGGYALHRANRRPRLPATWAQAPRTPPSSPASPASAAAGTATAAWVPPTASGAPQPAPVPGEGNDATPWTVVLPAPPGSNPQALDDAAVLEQDAGAVTADNVQEGGGERLQRGPGAGRALHNPSGAFTPTTLRARVRRRHVDRPWPPARPSFWQWLFAQKETKKAKPGKPRR